MPYATAHLDELGEGEGFRKLRAPLGIDAFGANAIVFAPGTEGFLHYHDVQDELYFVHAGRCRFEVDGDVLDLGPGSFVHVPATTPRKLSNPGDTELVVVAIGGKGGYVERDGRLVHPEDAERRAAFGRKPG